MVTVKNLTPSPYDLQTVDGFARLPALGEVTADFTDEYLEILKVSGAVEILEEPSKVDPLDHDGDGKKGGSKPAEQSEELTTLRSEYQDLYGKRAYHGWNAEELQAKIDAKLAE